MKKIFKIVGTALFAWVLLFAFTVDTAKANVCDETSGSADPRYAGTTLNSPSHLQVFQVGNTIRVKGRLIYDFDAGWEPEYIGTFLVYGCGFTASIKADGYAPELDFVSGAVIDSSNGTNCPPGYSFYAGAYSPGVLGLAGGNRVYIDNSTAGCDIDATFQIPNTSYFTDQNNDKADMLSIYPWWQMAEGDAVSGWTYPCSSADFGAGTHGCGAYNQGSIAEHIKLTSDPINAVCGTNAKTYLSTDTKWPSNTEAKFCSKGSLPRNMLQQLILPTFPAIGATATWTCSGWNGGINANCLASRSGYYWLLGAWSACEGVCGVPGVQSRTVECKDASGVTVADSLCPLPKPDITLACTMPACPAACGSANGGSTCVKPTTNLCSAGTASFVSGSGPWTWTCSGSGTVNCSSNKTASANGVCGSSSGETYASAPSSNLCSVGTASAVSGSGPWTWTCSGVCGGVAANCSASKQNDNANWIEVAP
jgi:hypothetical protein